MPYLAFGQNVFNFTSKNELILKTKCIELVGKTNYKQLVPYLAFGQNVLNFTSKNAFF